MRPFASIFLDFALPNAATWFYFSLLLAVGLFFKFNRFFSVRNFDILSLYLIVPGFRSNYGKSKEASFVYLTATLEAATWGAELALGEGSGRIYLVEPTGSFTDDPNLTDKKFPGNPTKSYRSREPLRVMGEVTDWQGHSPEALKAMREMVERARQQGIEAIDD